MKKEMIKHVQIKPKPRRMGPHSFDPRLFYTGIYITPIPVEFTSVSDKLPDNSDVYICSDGDNVFPMTYSEKDKRFLFPVVTHWADYKQFTSK